MGDRRLPQPARWSGWAWGAAAVAATFIGITCWWVSRDRGVPFMDAASHLTTAAVYHDLLRAGDVAGMLHLSGFYPPLTFVVGGLSTLVGGVNASAPVIGENLVYVTLLALGCYQTGKLVSGPAAGFLAVVFALGSPLLIEQLHVFMIDAPQAALVAVSVWLILASRRFSRVGVAALAGVAVGAGMASKEQFVIYVGGLLIVVLARQRGWRNGRGLLAFAACAFVVASPWYLANFSELGRYAMGVSASYVLPPRAKPDLLSVSNAGWYLWAVLNGLLFAPLFAFAAIGVGNASVGVLRRTRPRDVPVPLNGLAPELLAGLLVGWLGLTATPHHDMRYSMGLIVYLAVLGTAWIAPLSRPWRTAAAGALAVAVVATTLGATFGVGGQVRIPLAGHPIETDTGFGIAAPDQLTIYADRDFNLSAPRRADDVPALFAAMRRDGVTGVAWDPAQAPGGDPVFDSQGLLLLLRFNGLRGPDIGLTRLVTRDPARPPKVGGIFNVADPNHVYMTRTETLEANDPPYVYLSDGTYLRLVRGDPFDGTGQPYCPVE